MIYWHLFFLPPICRKICRRTLICAHETLRSVRGSGEELYGMKVIKIGFLVCF